ncbi:MAG: cytochrome b/b6 domain-containing protein [Roseiarcus sp.]|jgi:cytochrome b
MSHRGPDAALSADDAAGVGRKIVVWDVPTRVFHWLAVALIGAAYATARLNWMDWHARAGYALLVALLFRLLWGFFGSQTARFASFLASPRAAARHLAHALRREPDLQVGHNPAGGWMVLLLVALMLGETLSGLYVGNDIAEEGPLSERVPALIANLIDDSHDRFLWDALLAAIAIHLLAILAYAVGKRHNLLLPMVAGRKVLPPATRPPLMKSSARALLLLACSAAAAIALVKFV